MTSQAGAPLDDLAFLRALVAEGEGGPAGFGENYLAAGLIYGTQLLLHGAQLMGLLPVGEAWALAVGLGPTAVFIPVSIWIGARNRRPAATAAGRAIGASFAAIGATNLALAAIIGFVAWREHSMTTWFVFPCAAFVLQGAAWMVVFMLRRRPWQGLVTAGWFAFGVGAALAIDSLALYLACLGLGIWLCMALPGFIVMRAGRRPL